MALSRFIRRSIIGLYALGVLASASGAVRAQPANFRVETRVFYGEEKKQVSHNTTLFSDGVVYDFVAGSEITIFDPSAGWLAVLDPTRKLKTIVTTDQLIDFNAQLTKVVQQQRDPLLRFAVQPRFETRQGEGADEIVFASPLMTYHIRTVAPSNVAIATQYREFSDWYARLNVLFRPQALPPSARLVVNEHLARQRQMPRYVTLSLAPHPRFGNTAITLASDHSLQAGLTASDTQRLGQARDYLAKFRHVSLTEFRRPTPTAKK